MNNKNSDHLIGKMLPALGGGNFLFGNKSDKINMDLSCRAVGCGGTNISFYIGPEGIECIWDNENCPYQSKDDLNCDSRYAAADGHNVNIISWEKLKEFQPAVKKYFCQHNWKKEEYTPHIFKDYTNDLGFHPAVTYDNWSRECSLCDKKESTYEFSIATTMMERNNSEEKIPKFE